MKKKHKIILMIAAVILCAVLLVAAIRVFPLMQAARTLHRVMNAECVDFEVDVTLNPDRLSREQGSCLQLSRGFWKRRNPPVCLGTFAAIEVEDRGMRKFPARVWRGT